MGQQHLSHEAILREWTRIVDLRRAILSAQFPASQHRSDTTPEVNVRQMEKPGCQYAARRARGCATICLRHIVNLSTVKDPDVEEKIARTTSRSGRVI